MKASRHGFASLLGSNGTPSICTSCRNTLRQSRRAASTAAAVAEPSHSEPPASHSSDFEAASHKIAYHIRAGVVLSRPPQITRDLSPFEKSFYTYQRRLNERLAQRPMQYFYFRPDTPAMIEWKRKKKLRGGITPRDIGPYNGLAREGWNDEVIIGAEYSEPEWQAQQLIKDAAPLPKENEPVQEVPEAKHKLSPRVTEADKKNDQSRLDRLLQRTLYLLVQNAKGEWTFPEDVVQGRESLALAAERILTNTGGDNMNTWVVGNHPVGHRVLTYPSPTTAQNSDTQTLGEKVFFMKARMMAGRTDITANTFGIKDFKWLCREELEKQVQRNYWHSIKNMLPER